MASLLTRTLIALIVCSAAVGIVSNARADDTRPTLSVSEEDKVQPLRFDNERGQAKTASFTILLTPAPPKNTTPPNPSVSVRGDLRSAQDRRLSRSAVHTTALVWNGIDGFDATLDVTPPKGQSPGKYTGAVLFGGNGYVAVPVTLTATLRASKERSIIWAALGFIVGALLKAASDIFKAKGVKFNKKGLGQYFLRSGYIPTILLGIVGAFITWGYTYLGNSVWGAGDIDQFKLFAATLGGVVTGTTVGDFIKPFAPPT
jgi:hypothetical protein